MPPIDPAVVRDVVVVVPGIMGSTLVDARNREVWGFRGRTLLGALVTLGGSVDKLALTEDPGDGPSSDGIRAGSLMPALHAIPGVWTPIDGYASLLSFLRGPRFHLVERSPDQPWVAAPNLLPFPYDWRLSIRHNGRRLRDVAMAALQQWQRQPGMAEAKLILICHSMGGLVARWFVEQEDGAEHTRHLITIGTPHRGSVKPLQFLVNGIEKKIGPLQVRLTDFARTLPSLYQMLPTYNCLAIAGNTRVGLADETAPSLPDLVPSRVRDGAKMHASLAGEQPPAYAFHKVVGTRQPTLTTARLSGRKLIVEESIDGKYQGGDGTVPVMAAQPTAGLGTEVHEIAGKHGLLHGSRSALDLIEGILRRQEIVYQGTDPEAFGVAMDDVWTVYDQPSLRVPDLADRRLQVIVADELGNVVTGPVEVAPDGTAVLDRLGPGGYLATVASPVPGGPEPIRHPFVVIDPDAALPPEPPAA